MAFEEYVGREERHEDRVDPRLVAGMAATLGVPHPEGDLPPLWHWMLFQDWRPPTALGEDGHPRRGGFLPPVHDLPRRMWAGGRVRFGENGLRVGDAVRRRSTILSVEEKSGGSGRLVFVTVRHELQGPRGPVLSEEHDIVYRGAEGAAVRPASAAPDWPEALTEEVLPDAVLLFRYSALTGNSHRIHYDQPYVTAVERYPGLVVHGPLQATWLAAHALRAAEGGGPTGGRTGGRLGARLARFSYRGLRPCFADRPLRLLGAVGEGGAVRVESRDDAGATCQKAEAELA